MSQVPKWHPDYVPPEPPCTCKCHWCLELCQDNDDEQDEEGEAEVQV